MTSRESLHLPNIQVIIGLDGNEAIQKMLRETGKFYCNTLPRTQVNIIDENTAPDIFIIDIEAVTDIEIELINDLNLAYHGVPIVVVSHALEEQQFRRLLQINVQDWLPSPVNYDELLTTLTKWSNLRKSTNNRVHAIVSAAGGVGGSTLAITLADIAAHKHVKKRISTALVDLDFSLGDCGNYLDVQNSMDLAQVLSEPHRLDSELIGLIRIEHNSGIFVYSYKAPQLSISLNINEMTLRLLDLMSMSHDTSFLDIPYYEQPWKDYVLAAVDTVTIVTTNSIANIKHAHDLVKRVKAVRGTDEDINLIINKHEKRWFGRRMDDARAKEVFEGLNVCYLPWDQETMEDSISQGISAYEANKSSGFVKQVLVLEKKLTNHQSDGQVS
jgi:pilus assembly protein CpaE